MARILLVEDDESLAAGLSFTLDRDGHQVTGARTRAEAERCLAAERFDMLVLDVMLPDGSGFDICRAVRRHSALPVIFLTAGARLAAGPLTIDFAGARVYRGTEEVRLSAEEFRLLAILARNPGATLTRRLILESLLDAERPFVDDNTLSVYVRRLREKLEEDASQPRLIVTVRGLGYRWEPGA